MKIAVVRPLGALVLILTLGSPARAQVRDPLVQLEPGVRYRIELLVDSARLAGLPTAPLQSKALEGVARRADDRKILLEVTRVYRSLLYARAAVGPKVSTDELTAAAAALRIGVTQEELADLARSRQDKILTVPLVILTDLITRGVPRDTASVTIYQLFQRGAADDDFLGLWRGVERDIVSGTDPGQALLNRAREVPSRGPPPASAPAGSGRPDISETPDR